MNVHILDKVRRIASDIFNEPVEDITLTSSRSSVANWDSFQNLGMAMELEQVFAIKLMPEEIERMISIAAVVALIEEKLIKNNL